MPFDRCGEIAFVTGADPGIGQGIARGQAGADGRSPSAPTVWGRYAGRRAAVRRLDVGDAGDVGTGVEQAEAVLGVPDILVNNAGVGGGDEVAR